MTHGLFPENSKYVSLHKWFFVIDVIDALNVSKGEIDYCGLFLQRFAFKKCEL